MNIGDIVKYVGAEIAEKSGKLLPDWIPLDMYTRGDVGIIYGKTTTHYNTFSDIKMVVRYHVRMMLNDECLVHNNEVFYEFELEKV